MNQIINYCALDLLRTLCAIFPPSEIVTIQFACQMLFFNKYEMRLRDWELPALSY